MTQHESQSSFVDDFNASIKDNPIAASLIGLSAFWMVLGATQFQKWGPSLPAVGLRGAKGTVPMATAAARAVSASTQAVGEEFLNVGSKVNDLGEQVSSSVQSATATLREKAQSVATEGLDQVDEAAQRASEAFRVSSEVGRHHAKSLRTQLHHALERQPLLLGAIGLALGAGIAAAFPGTRTENRMVGAAAEDARKRAVDLASEGSEFIVKRGKEVFEDMKHEAEAQGLTSTHAVEEITGKVKNLAAAASDSFGENLPKTHHT